MPLIATRGAASAQGFGEFAQSAAVNYIEEVFSTYLYTGNGSNQTITNGIDLSTKGGLVWFKRRNADAFHQLYDTARGVQQTIYTNATNAQTSKPVGLTAFNANGFTVGDEAGVNGSGDSQVSWTFREQPKFFDIVTWSGDDASKVLSHNLGSVPGCIVVKSLVGTGNWQTWHRSLTAGNYIRLNTTAAQSSAGAQTVFGNNTITVDPTSTQFTVGSNICAAGENYIAYLFAHDAGGFGLTGTDNVISCGSYTGNGSATGPVVTLGYEPQWLLVKNASGEGDWRLYDSMRGLVVQPDSAGGGKLLLPNLSNAEADDQRFSPTATGFNVVSAGASVNANGSTYIYIAIRRGPMKVPTVGTSVFSPNTATGSALVTTNFPVDASISSETGASTGATWGSRLQGTKQYLLSYNTGAEASFGGNGWGFSNNTGLNQALYGGSTPSVFWNFQRAPGYMDVVCYTGTGSATTQTHNLGAVPELVIWKRRSSTSDWRVWQSSFSVNDGVYLNSTLAKDTDPNVQTAIPTATVLNLATGAYTNASGSTYVTYLFASCAGVSKVGSYTGNAGNTVVVPCGFTSGVRFVLIKRADSTGDWYVWDSARGIVAGNDPYLLLNSTAAEVTGTDYVDTYAAGFEVTSTAPAGLNATGGTYIFLAIA